MIKKGIHERYLDALLKGDRGLCRSVIEETLQSGTPANMVYIEVIWPIMCEIESLWRDDRINPAQEHMAVRINRTIVDQLQNKLPRRETKNRSIVVCCAPEEMQELGAQIIADLFESDGWEVKFLGGGLTNDDLLAYVNDYAPDVFMIYGTAPKQAPSIRQLIDTIKGINAHPNMRIMVSGGLFNRADGLWQEIGADLYAPSAHQAVEAATDQNLSEPCPERIVTRRKKRKKKQTKVIAVQTAK